MSGFIMYVATMRTFARNFVSMRNRCVNIGLITVSLFGLKIGLLVAVMTAIFIGNVSLVSMDLSHYNTFLSETTRHDHDC